jgi:aminoglycoside phosphotransferase
MSVKGENSAIIDKIREKATEVDISRKRLGVSSICEVKTDDRTEYLLVSEVSGRPVFDFLHGQQFFSSTLS